MLAGEPVGGHFGQRRVGFIVDRVGKRVPLAKVNHVVEVGNLGGGVPKVGLVDNLVVRVVLVVGLGCGVGDHRAEEVD